MKYILSLLLGSAFLTAAPMASEAQRLPDKAEDKYANERRVFDGHDHNKDGVIADFEYKQDMIRDFKLRDPDGNGKISRGENINYLYHEYLRKHNIAPNENNAFVPRYLYEEFEARFNLEDLNGDNLVLEYENLLAHKRIFSNVDANKDNYVSWDEFLTYLNKRESGL